MVVFFVSMISYSDLSQTLTGDAIILCQYLITEAQWNGTIF